MNAFVRKEIRLLAPSWCVAALLALVQAVTRPYDFNIIALMFFGTTMMALATFGRESSLNTFSDLLAQPAERLRIWQTKLTVLAIGFLLIFGIWFVAYLVASVHAVMDADDIAGSSSLFITVCLVAISTFTGGLWTTLLLRQIAGAFWLSLLVPATLSGFTAAFVTLNHSDDFIIVVFCVILGLYSIGGFFFARWLFFRAQDIGWSGGTIALPQWEIFSRASAAASVARNRKPVLALLKKEIQLQQVPMMGAIALAIVHLGVIFFRKYHTFEKDSASGVIAVIFWLVWLVLPVMVGGIAIAEERRLGVMESQLCLPVSRWLQFFTKASVTLLLGVLLGGVMPVLMEKLANTLGAPNPIFLSEPNDGGIRLMWFWLMLIGASTWLTLVSFYGSSLAKNFLQAIGIAIVTFIACGTLITLQMRGELFILDSAVAASPLPLVIGIPVLILALLWLASLNLKNFRSGWPLWRRNILGFASALLFIIISSIAVYYRAWEHFIPVEPAHGPARLTRSTGLKMQLNSGNTIQLSDGRVWVYQRIYSVDTHQYEKSTAKFLPGSNWVDFTTCMGFFFGIQSDGSLWTTAPTTPGTSVIDYMRNPHNSAPERYGTDHDWKTLVTDPGNLAVSLLKSDGSLWRFEFNLKRDSRGIFLPYTLSLSRLGTDSVWTEIFKLDNSQVYFRKSDGGVWAYPGYDTTQTLQLASNMKLTQVAGLEKYEWREITGTAQYYIGLRADGSLRALRWESQDGRWALKDMNFSLGTGTNWVAVASAFSGVGGNGVVSLRSDGTLWRWHISTEPYPHTSSITVERLGTHSDWVAIEGSYEGIQAVAADGTIWYWPLSPTPITFFGLFNRADLIEPSFRPQKLASLFDTK